MIKYLKMCMVIIIHTNHSPYLGEYIDERGIVCSISKIEKNILCISDDIEKSDETFYVHSGGLIYDVEVYCNRDDIVKTRAVLI